MHNEVSYGTQTFYSRVQARGGQAGIGARGFRIAGGRFISEPTAPVQAPLLSSLATPAGADQPSGSLSVSRFA
jgi:hypothetical protein